MARFRRASNQGMAKAQGILSQPVGAEGAFTGFHSGLATVYLAGFALQGVEPGSTEVLSRALGALQAHPRRVSGHCFDASPNRRVRTSVPAMLALERAVCGERVTLLDDHGSIFT